MSLKKRVMARLLALVLMAALLLGAGPVLPGKASAEANGNLKKPKNVVLLIGDGMGFEQVEAYSDTVGRHIYMDQVNDATGKMTTRSADAAITDSSSAATAMASGYKINNNVLGLLPDGTRVRTVVEMAEDKGLATGLVTTTQIAHATPAGFATHVTHRNQFNNIAAQYFDDFAAKGKPIEVLMGGGWNNFTPDGRRLYYETEGKKYGDGNDSRDLIRDFTSKGYTFVNDATKLAAVNADRVLGLFEPKDGLTPEVKRPANSTQPHLWEMTAKALETLAKNKDGFFLMVEGGQIDWACHANDRDYLLGEMAGFDRSVKAALDFQAAHPDTLVLVTADHETGGLNYNPDDRSFKWSSKDHTATPVPVMAEGPGAELFKGTIDNTDIARKIAGLLSLNFVPAMTFKDTAGHWVEQGNLLDRLVGRAIVKGYPGGLFMPDKRVTRSEFAVMLAGALNLQQNSAGAEQFVDAATIPAWAQGSVGALAAAGLLKGYQAGKGFAFAPGREITRSELAVLIAGTLQNPGKAELKFTDSAGIPAWAREGIAQVVAQGIITGYPDGSFGPARPASRAETAVMLSKCLNPLGI